MLDQVVAGPLVPFISSSNSIMLITAKKFLFFVIR